MASKHGNRIYVQVLLEPSRGELLLQLARRYDVKPSALLRTLAYQYIADNTDESTYATAEALDKENHKQAVNARLEGKAKKYWEALGLDDLTPAAASQPQEPQCGLPPASAANSDENSAA